MDKHTRRTFMGLVGAGIAAAAARPTKAAPSERVRHAVIGCGGQGSNHARTLDRFDDCEIAVLCDVDPERLSKVRAALSNAASVQTVSDFRRVLEDPSVDSVSVATADHWHTPIALHALQAGKHVYVEKPCSHNVHESLVLDEAVGRYGKCVQHGTQSRSSEGVKTGIAYLRAGNLGKVRLAKAINHQMRRPIGRAPVTDPPPGVDYDMWLGPAPVHAFTKNRWHYNWHWFWDYGCGDIANDGVHQIDVARWGLDVTWPRAVQGAGGQLFYEDDHETPDTQTIVYDYGDCQLVYEMRLWTDYYLEGHDNGVVFYCDDGTLEIGREGSHVTRIGGSREKIGGGADFAANLHGFLDAVKADDPALLDAPIREGAVSAALCHFGNIVTRIGRGFKVEPGALVTVDDADARALLQREYRKGYELPAIG